MVVAATGFFDGVHLGHRLVIETLVAAAKERGGESLVLTFWPHPRTVLSQDGGIRLLTSLEEKTEILKSLGVDRVETLEFTREFASMKAEQYVREILIGRFGVGAVVLGYDTRMGADQLGPDAIERLCVSLGLEVIRCAPVSCSEAGLDWEGEISSSKIRTAIAEGRLKDAEIMLGKCSSCSSGDPR